MSPLNIEVLHPEKNEWLHVGQVQPGQQPGSISQNKPDKTRELYYFECRPDDSESIIYKSKAGVDVSTQQIRIFSTVGLEKAAVLRDGESYVSSIKTDIGDVRRPIRFTHIKAIK